MDDPLITAAFSILGRAVVRLIFDKVVISIFASMAERQVLLSQVTMILVMGFCSCFGIMCGTIGLVSVV